MTSQEVQADLQKVLNLLNHVLAWLPSKLDNKVLGLLNKVDQSPLLLNVLTAIINVAEDSAAAAPTTPATPTK